jgi:hypothetical protein
MLLDCLHLPILSPRYEFGIDPGYVLRDQPVLAHPPGILSPARSRAGSRVLLPPLRDESIRRLHLFCSVEVKRHGESSVLPWNGGKA